MRVNSVRKVNSAGVQTIAKAAAKEVPIKPNLAVASDEFTKAQNSKVSMGGLIGVCALGISILYGTFKLTDTLFKRF